MVPKKHPMLTKMIGVFTQDDKIYWKSSNEYFINLQLKNLNIGLEQGYKCSHCFRKFQGKNYLRIHKIKYHEPPFSNRLIPYKLMKEKYYTPYICQVGCGFVTKDKLELLRHMVIWHSKIELEPWGISRDYLKFLCGYKVGD